MGFDDIVGASKSLRLTIAELDSYLESEESHSPSELRSLMYEKVADVAAYWLQEGFACGHRESFKAYKEIGEIPATLQVTYDEAWLSPSCERDVPLKSRIRRI